jgi:transposase
MAPFDLSEVEWRLIRPLLPNKPRDVARVDDRRVLNGTFYMLRTGSPWRDLPERYGPYTTVYNRFNRWARAGVWGRVFETLSTKSPKSMALIDSSIIRAHQHAAGGKKRHHAAMLVGDMDTVARLRSDAHELVYKFNGYNPDILADEEGPGCVLDRLTRAGEGSVPLWGQSGSCEIGYRDMQNRRVQGRRCSGASCGSTASRTHPVISWR